MNHIRRKIENLRAIKLTPQERFVLSCLDAPMSLAELSAKTRIDEARLEGVVEGLAGRDAVDIESALATPVPTDTRTALSVFGVTDVGAVRTNNEDAFAILDLEQSQAVDGSRENSVHAGHAGVLLLVSDGMGGANAGEVASAMAIESIKEHFADSTTGDAPADLAAAVAHANDRVIDAAQMPGREGMGATMVAVLIAGSDAYTAEIGDSRAYLLRSGVLTRLTKDQTYVQLLIDQGRLDTDSAKMSQAKNLVLQAVGKAETLIVAQRCIALRRDDRLLLCSDGLTLHVEEREIATALGGESLEHACRDLIELAKERGGKDNITVVAARLAEPLPAAIPGEDVADTIATIREFDVERASQPPA